MRDGVRAPTTISVVTLVAFATLILPIGATSAGAAPTAKKSSFCTAMTTADVTKAFGEPAVPTEQSTDQCWYKSAKSGLKVVNLIRRTDDVAEWSAGYRGNPYWAPNGLGDEGYSGKVLDSITWRDGKTEYEVNLTYSTRGNSQRAVQQLAKKAYARIHG